ncbi:MAG: transglutaminase family protein [Roseburia sp.]|nr:transglutaminase family protein [Roseburia sp.]MCM1243204.1 transglutaminase family protein [Roseburia sp.]
MKNLFFDYRMRISYTEPVGVCHYTIRCIPAVTENQRLVQMEMEIMPEDKHTLGVDSFGNRLITGRVDADHDSFVFHIQGEVQTGLCGYEEAAGEEKTALYKYPSKLTTPGTGLKAYYESLVFTEGMSDYEKAVFMMHRLYNDFIYEKGVTGVETTAEETWNIGKGVCQDYAHILIALCRLAGIPARYITGMMVGEGYSHAWIEILSEGKWYALDPTNDLIVEDEHIKIGSGRDAADCMINRGIMKGGGRQDMTVTVKVTEK